jgi:hypothetical protein
VAEEYDWLRAKLVEWRERRYARKVCAEALAACQAVRADDPDLKGHRLYGRVVRRRTECDEQGDQALVRRAEESFTLWPIERDLNFRDVVEYMIISEYFGSSGVVTGTRTDVKELIKPLIPDGL